ncbi:hypothetical protein, partial [Actinomadura sp. KC06]|uniref:hypothetical protein n=1 Tax=Actinomadura sp. KC06 TaxID=2530369 RepID=UPI001404F99B
ASPAPGSEIPDQPGYVVGTCGHRVAAQEWRAGLRTCERDPAGPIDRYADAVTQALTAAKVPCHPPRVGAGISIELPVADASLNWSVSGGWSIHGRGPRREQVNARSLHLALVPTPVDIARKVRAWLEDPARLPSEYPVYPRVEVDELNTMLDRAAQGDQAQEAGR